jgi:hypothetical protein
MLPRVADVRLTVVDSVTRGEGIRVHLGYFCLYFVWLSVPHLRIFASRLRLYSQQLYSLQLHAGWQKHPYLVVGGPTGVLGDSSTR